MTKQEGVHPEPVCDAAPASGLRGGEAEGAAGFTMPIQNHTKDRSLDGPFVWVPTAADRQQAKTNHSQTLERLAQRGGMSWCEMAAIVLNKRWQKFEQPYAKAICRDVLIMRARQASPTQVMDRDTGGGGE